MIPKPSDARLVFVLDTNVCLDLFVFHDPRWQRLLLALQQGRVSAITKTSCRDEWLAVLHYKQLPVTDDNRPAIIQAFDALITCLDLPPATGNGLILPICTDPDDQQFMELARDAGATHLVSKDKALLKCARRVARLGLFSILTPESLLTTLDF